MNEPAKSPQARTPAKRKRAPISRQGTQITVTVDNALLRRLDAFARETGQSRSGLMKVGIARVLRDGV